ncbi:MAG: MATE family efflux transporter [bacterium]|nr:MATE family efflux transporter [bacterium]
MGIETVYLDARITEARAGATQIKRPKDLTDPMPTTPRSPFFGKIDFSLTRQILTLTLPVALTRQLDNVVGMADIYMVGKLGPEAISAVGISRTIVMVISVTMIAITTGAFAMIAQAVGAQDEEKASAAAKQSISLLAVFSIFPSCIGIVGAPHFLRALSLAPEVVVLATPYLRVFFGGSIFMMLNFSITTCLQASGNTRTPFYISLFNNGVKLVLSYLLIFGLFGLPELGVVGAAVGGVIGRGLGVIIGFGALYSGKYGIRLLPTTQYKPDFAQVRKILQIGIPAALQGMFRNGSGVVLVKLVAMTSASTTAVAAFSIGSQMERLVRQISLAFGTAATTLVGQSIGAGELREADKRGWTTLALAVITVSIVGLPIALFAKPLLAFFTDAQDVVEIGVLYLVMIVVSEPFMCAAITSGGSLRGAGDNMPALYYTLIAQWAIRLPVAAFLAFWMGFDIYGIWYSLIIFCALQGFLTVRKFAQGHWKSRKI